MRKHLAVAEIDIAAPAEQVWHVLTDNALLGEVMFGSEVVTDWQVGARSSTAASGRASRSKTRARSSSSTSRRRLRVTHFSPLGGDADVPENYHQVQYDLAELRRRHARHPHAGQQHRGRSRRALDGQLADDAGVPQKVSER